MGVTEVTQEQYEAVMGNNPSHFKGANRPVESVSWHDAMEFCRKLSQRTGKTVRLPTEAEWEYACRAGEKGPYAGTGKLDEMGWYRFNSDGKTHPVGQKMPNAWGLYDMHGNVWEWCADFDGDYAGAGTDPTGPKDGGLRVRRGGSWFGSPRSCRSAYRYGSNPVSRLGGYGFRVAVSAGVDLP